MKHKVLIVVGVVALVVVAYLFVRSRRTAATGGAALSSPSPASRQTPIGAAPVDPTTWKGTPVGPGATPTRGTPVTTGGWTGAVAGATASINSALSSILQPFGGAPAPSAPIDYAQRYDGVSGNDDGLALYELPGSNS